MGSLPDYKDIIKLIKTGATIEAQEKIMEMRIAMVGLQERNLELVERVKKLEKSLSLSEKMEFKKPFYYAEGDETPFCPVCWENKRTAIHLIGPTGQSEQFKCPCPTCDFEYYTKERPLGISVVKRPRSNRALLG